MLSKTDAIPALTELYVLEGWTDFKEIHTHVNAMKEMNENALRE
jgi:hypothetical protein